MLRRKRILLLFFAVVLTVIAAEQLRNFELLTSAQIASELKVLSAQYPQFATLHTAQELFGLPAAGDESDCTFDTTFGCHNYFLTILDSTAHPPNSESVKYLPDVFLSGALHGNERVGPTATLETAKLLLEAAYCESLPRYTKAPDLNTEDGSDWSLEVQEALACRENLAVIGITDAQRKWLARLVTTRRIVISPMTNALGYDRNTREEGNIDPNRDFPFDQNPTECMQTIAGRTINELFRSHLFQMSLTFHAGTEVVAYEWGAYPYKNFSPDDTAQRDIASSYSQYAGSFDGTPLYKTGTMNELVYPVKGGMEDWAYAGSWDSSRVIPCQPNTFDGYPQEKTIYNESTLRAFNMLIETSDRKIPHSHLGSNHNLLDDNQHEYNGHVSRNIRLALMAIELVQPYVSFWGVDKVPLQSDIVPDMRRNGQNLIDGKVMMIPPGQKLSTIAWTVGGGITVDNTELVYDKLDDNSNIVIDVEDENFDLRAFTKRASIVSSGPTRWQSNWQSSYDGLPSGWQDQGQPLFFASIDISQLNPGDKIIAYAVASFDQNWKQVPNKAQPENVKPLSHVVNARTNPEWRHENADKRIQGKLEFVSLPMVLIIGDEADGHVTDLSNRLIIHGYNPGTPQHKSSKVSSLSVIMAAILITIGVIALLYYVKRLYTKKKWKAATRLSDVLENEEVFEFEISSNEDIELQGTWT
jgi:hypothetical protein